MPMIGAYVPFMPPIIRSYRDADAPAVRALIVELQDDIRRIDPALPAGESMADACLVHTFRQTRECAGHLLVAEADYAITRRKSLRRT
jgi:hypothetical protein